jgi:hypothetical protein
MSLEQDLELEKRLDAELKNLSPLAAPPSLIPRVLAVLQERAQKSWWQRAWWEWPLTAKLAFVVIALAIAGAFSSSGIMLGEGVTEYSQSVTEHLFNSGEEGGMLDSLISVIQVLWTSLAQPVLLYIVAGAGVLYLSCIALGTAFFRVALKRA